MAEKIRILIADDHPMVRSGMQAFLNSVPDIEIVGEAGSGEEAVAAALEQQPDVVLMDIQMPGLNGIEATRQILRDSPHIGMIMVTIYDDNDAIFASMQAGARGYILKGADQAEILRAIHAVSNGEALFSPGIAQRLVNYFTTLGTVTTRTAFPELTERERQILNLIAKGSNNQQISERLSLSLKTVRNHISNIFSKLQVADRAQAILKARDAGLK